MLGSVTIIFINGHIVHYIDCTFAVDLNNVIVNQWDEREIINSIKYDLKDIKSLHYDY